MGIIVVSEYNYLQINKKGTFPDFRKQSTDCGFSLLIGCFIKSASVQSHSNPSIDYYFVEKSLNGKIKSDTEWIEWIIPIINL